ncbi:pyrrolysine--tRNA(Pyl) ligase large subunit [Parasporobacterium paucivorans]|uniref:Pyrrolysyl-tRNA synthetase n=1 Tax=Parasporobacterium paucivorans DSM 15970 TaxID=1122934 RepID=A0A1M6II44_9FIRM|nr:pyrrolysine--tRNA(Pyl) ligase large subunit [Parasporobacterium paucivorans]SHJ34066.1 Pyrrolysyl-tRNA synthetase [Parasporobacterium paucivorans DSM 15970]
MSMEFTESQKNRLTELGVRNEILTRTFDETKEREQTFARTEKMAVKENKAALSHLLANSHKPALCQLQQDLTDALCGEGFTQVTTPIIISASKLEKMTIDKTNPLHEQVFWLDSKSCLRPMLAPNLYEVSRQLMTSIKLPLRIFEIGSCFRKESEGNAHLKEFTMLNLVEWGTPEEKRSESLKEFAELVLKAARISDYRLEEEDSVVYGPGLDIVSGEGMELASTSMGPHPLDAAWKINCTWVGIGFGLERLLMHREKQSGIHRHSKSTVFLDGACLKVK